MSARQQPLSPEQVRHSIGNPIQQQGQGQMKPLSEHELPPEIRKIIQERMSQGGNPMEPIQGGIVNRTTTTSGETQMPPQFIGRTVNETYLNPNELPAGFNQQPQARVIG